jgi:hypothetical protein
MQFLVFAAYAFLATLHFSVAFTFLCIFAVLVGFALVLSRESGVLTEARRHCRGGVRKSNGGTR